MNEKSLKKHLNNLNEYLEFIEETKKSRAQIKQIKNNLCVFDFDYEEMFKHILEVYDKHIEFETNKRIKDLLETMSNISLMIG